MTMRGQVGVRDRQVALPIITAAILGVAMMAAPEPASAQPTVIVVRHGEKADGGKDPVLSPAGEARAERLAAMLAASRVRAIYTTQYQRTQLLAAPLAKKTGVTPVVVPAADEPALLKRVQSHPDGEVVLVVGHSNTVPSIIKGLGVREAVSVGEDEYDNLFIVVPRGEQPQLLRMKY